MVSCNFLNFKKKKSTTTTNDRPSFSLPPSPNRNTRWERIKYPSGVSPEHITFVTYLGRIGFIAKGIVYAVMGGLCISTAQQLGDDVDGLESPMGAFIFLGLFTIGTPILVIMFIGLSFYSLWRFWEGGLGQGSDATRSPPSNFFRYRLSPIVSGCVYVAYLSYIGKLLSTSREGRMDMANNSGSCFPACWGAGDVWHRMAVGVGGVAFIIAFITQVQNGFSNRWHADLMIHHCTSVEKYTMLVLGHLGFLGRAGVFMFVAVFMFRSLNDDIRPQRDTFSDAINQIIGVHGGTVGLWFLGIGLILFGIFAACNAYYKYYPTPPPSRIGFPSKRSAQIHETPQTMAQRVNQIQSDHHSETRSSIASAENHHVNLPMPSSTPPLLPMSIVCKSNDDNSNNNNNHDRDLEIDNHSAMTSPASLPTYSLSAYGNTVNSDKDHRFSGSTAVYPAETTTTKDESAATATAATTITAATITAATVDGSVPTNMAVVDSEERSLPDAATLQDISRPPSPFLQTRRYRWQMKRLERISNNSMV